MKIELTYYLVTNVFLNLQKSIYSSFVCVYHSLNKRKKILKISTTYMYIGKNNSCKKRQQYVTKKRKNNRVNIIKAWKQIPLSWTHQKLKFSAMQWVSITLQIYGSVSSLRIRLLQHTVIPWISSSSINIWFFDVISAALKLKKAQNWLKH